MFHSISFIDNQVSCLTWIYSLPQSYMDPTSDATLRSSGLLLGQRCEPQVGLDDAEVWEELLGLVVVDRGVDNDVVTWDPVTKSAYVDPVV